MVRAIIVAAGSSRRMGFDKTFAPLHGKPVLYWSIAAFQKCKDVADIMLDTGCDSGCAPGQVGAAVLNNGMISGSVDARVGWSVQTTTGELVWPHVFLGKVSFNLPVFRDDDPALIGG